MENIESTVKKKRKTKKIIGIVSIILSIIIAFVGGYFTRYLVSPKEVNTTTEIISIIEKYGYVVDQNGNLKNLSEREYANALISGLNDNYAKYYTKEEYQKVKSQQKGDYSGFGITINTEKEYPLVINIIGNSPAEKAGLKIYDKLISAKTGEQKVEFNSVDIGDYLNSVSANTTVQFEVERNAQTLYINITKSSYKASYVKYYDNQGRVIFDVDGGQTTKIEQEKIDVDEKTALIKIDSFEGDVANQFGKALDYMQISNRTKLILDLRDNGGGYMDDLLSVCRHLIYNGGKKTLIAHAKGKSSDEGFYMHGPIKRDNITDIVVLANDNTASASECLIGAMLFYGEKNFSKAKLVLEKNSDGVAKTFGKGIMQTTFSLLNGGAFKLTTARILWPDVKTCIHGTGITTTLENEVGVGSAISRAKEILS